MCAAECLVARSTGTWQFELGLRCPWQYVNNADQATSPRPSQLDAHQGCSQSGNCGYRTVQKAVCLVHTRGVVTFILLTRRYSVAHSQQAARSPRFPLTPHLSPIRRAPSTLYIRTFDVTTVGEVNAIERRGSCLASHHHRRSDSENMLTRKACVSDSVRVEQEPEERHVMIAGQADARSQPQECSQGGWKTRRR